MRGLATAVVVLFSAAILAVLAATVVTVAREYGGWRVGGTILAVVGVVAVVTWAMLTLGLA